MPNNVLAANKPKRKKKWTRVGVPPHVCIVCGDGAYGYNFGQITCESCKAFFRRHINKPRNYVCPGDRQCNVSCKTRKYCPACRLRKCFDVGLNPEIGRVTNEMRLEKRKAKGNTTSSSDGASSCKHSALASDPGSDVTSQRENTVNDTSGIKEPMMTVVQTSLSAESKMQAAEESPSDDNCLSVSPFPIPSPGIGGSCETPASINSWSVSIPSVGSLSAIQGTDVPSPDDQAKADIKYGIADNQQLLDSEFVKPFSLPPNDASSSLGISTQQSVTAPPARSDMLMHSTYNLNDAGAPMMYFMNPNLMQHPAPMTAIPQIPIPMPFSLPRVNSSKYDLSEDDFTRLRVVCNTLVLTMQQPMTDAELGVLQSKSLPETMYELMAVAEAAMRRFVRFTKQLDDFRNSFSFDERVAVLRRALLTCHIFTFSFGFDIEKRDRYVQLADGTEHVYSGPYIAELKRRAGLPESSDPRPAYIELHSAIRKRFPKIWRMLTAAFALVALVTPSFHGTKAPKTDKRGPNAGTKKQADLSCLNLEQENKASLQQVESPMQQPSCEPQSYGFLLPPTTNCGEDGANQMAIPMPQAAAEKLIGGMRPLYRMYKAFVPRYIEYMEKTSLSETEKRLIVRFCKERVAEAHSVANNITNRVGLMAAYDPSSVTTLMPLYNELADT